MAWDLKARHFDFDDGRSASTYTTKWASSTRGSVKKLQTFKNDSGASSLLDMCWRMILVNLPCLDCDSLRTVPWSIGLRLWKEICKNELVSVSTWKAFVVTYHDDIIAEPIRGLIFHAHTPRIMSSAVQSLQSPHEEGLPLYINHITAPAFEWVNLVSIVDAELARQDWIALAKIQNLGALFIQNSNMQSGCIDDTVIKAWSNAARETGAFSIFKVLLLQNQSQVTMDILEYLSHLPALKILHLTTPKYKANRIQETLRGSRWTWIDRSKLYNKLVMAWHGHYSMSTRLKNLYTVVHQNDLIKEGSLDKPMLNIISGPDPTIGLAAHREDNWFELANATFDEHRNDITKRAPETCQDLGAQSTSKKLKMRMGMQKSMADVLGDLMTTPQK